MSAKIIFLKAETGDSNPLVSVLMLSSMKANYPELVEERGFDGADIAMANLYGDHWDSCKEVIWQWYDKEAIDVN